MPVEPNRVQALFLAAIELTDPTARATLLDRECSADPTLRARIEALLAAHDDSAGLPAPPVDERTGAYVPAAPAPELTVGTLFAERYKIREKLGEGGMGTVYVADQTQPVTRRVALKVIKADVSTARLLARFEQERQALALMDHPNIAKVLDAGVAGGTPYFVMELIKGVPITKYCDDAKLTPRQRLELFIPVCQAVQHAHQKGIIHRDLKPSNIMVGLYDGRPVPKVIDFGVAKATGSKLTDQSVYTEVGSMIGTLEYMSPEQAELNNLDIDTRSDIYALGVVLYELLTGTVPHSRKELRAGGMAEMLRIIKEVEPQKPSTKLSGSGSLPSLAANRQTKPKKLTKLFRGELDWMVMKALEKDRSRRYETVNGFALDIQRYLADEPVMAGPPSARYRMKKFVKRNKGQVVAAGLVLLALLGGIGGTTWGMVRAERSRVAEVEQRVVAETKEQEAVEAAAAERLARNAEAEQRKVAEANEKIAKEEKAKAVAERQIADAVRQFLQNDLLRQADAGEQADMLRLAGRDAFEVKENPTIKEVLDRTAAGLTVDKIDQRFPNQPLVQAEILHTVGRTYKDIGEYAKAIDHLSRSMEIFKSKLGAEHTDTLISMGSLANAFLIGGKLDLALPLLEETLKLRKAKLGPEHPDTLESMNNLAAGYQDAGNLDLALPLLEATLNLNKANLGIDHPDTLTSMNNLAGGYRDAGKLDLALPLLEATLKLRKAKLGPDHPTTLLLLYPRP